MKSWAWRMQALKERLLFDLAACSAAERGVIQTSGKEDGAGWGQAGLLLKEPVEQKIECYLGWEQ